MKIFRKFFCCLFALALSGMLLYADILCSFPSEITMYQNQRHKSNLGAGVTISNIPEDLCTSKNERTVTPAKLGYYDATLKIADTIPFRRIRINVSEQKNIYASGALIGLRIYNKGLIVTNLAPITCGGAQISPAQNAGVLPGDIILEINGKLPKTGDNVSALITDNTTLTLRRGSTVLKIPVEPARDDTTGEIKLGIWVRDSTAGVGTLTYFDPFTNTYGALGHGINDSDTGIMFEVGNGTIEKSRVVSVKKGQRGSPGEICGSFSSQENIFGSVTKNCEAGIFGNMFPNLQPEGTSLPIGVMSQVETGDAAILSTVDGSIKEYKISILRAMPFGSATKGLAIEITDEVLLEKTGGIIQGMSGSPIIQNGKIIGAVTHVLVNDPTRGYGIFIENMLKEAG